LATKLTRLILAQRQEDHSRISESENQRMDRYRARAAVEFARKPFPIGPGVPKTQWGFRDVAEGEDICAVTDHNRLGSAPLVGINKTRAERLEIRLNPVGEELAENGVGR